MSIISTQAFTFRLIANGQQLDVFQDEDIKLSNNVTGLFDIGQLPSEFTRQITLPGTKVNNAFFEHVYDISIDNPFLFATNIKVPAYFDFVSVYLSNGYIQLNKVNLLANKFIDSYEITMFGTLSSFGRDINRSYLTDLNSLTKYNHTSSYDNIKLSWETGSTGLFNHDIIYPWCDYGSAWQYTSDVFFGVDDNYGGLSVQDYKPAIRAKAVVDAIFEEAGYTYSSSFLNQEWFQDVYMVCNNSLRYPEYADVDLETFGVMKLGAISGSTNITIPINTWTTLPWQNELIDPGGSLNNGAYTVTKQSNLSGIFNLNFSVSSSGNLPGQFGVRLIETSSAYTTGQIDTIPTWAQYFTQFANGRSSTQSIGQDFELQSQVQFPAVPTGSYYFQVKINEYYVTTDPLIKVDPNTSGGDVTTKSYIQIKKVNQAADGRIMDIPSNMPYGTSGIKQIDFILGLQKKFNLVIYPNRIKLNEFVIETFNDWYKKGEVKDFNKYINLDKNIEVIPANNLAVNKLNFGDTLDQDYISLQFSKAANREYGKTYYTDTNNFYSQGEYSVKSTFASSPLIRMPGTGLSGSVGGITPIYSYGTFNTGVGYTTATYACRDTSYYPNTLYSLGGVLSLYSVLWTDPNFTTTFNGKNKFYQYYSA